MTRAASIAEAVGRAIHTAAVELRPDVRDALERAREAEPSERGRDVIGQLLENARIAAEDGVPLCQDTGTVWVRVEQGPDVCIEGDLQREVDAAVRAAYDAQGLRMSVLRDAVSDRTNTGDNTPAFLEIAQKRTPGTTLHVMLKGGGSDNASALTMLEPSAGLEGVQTFVLELVRAKAASACPPLVIGVAVGGTFDTVAGLAKKALLREVGSSHPDAQVAALEERLLEAVNATGIGPAGLGGATTALAVHVATAPAHIAALPVAVNMGCSAMRSVSVDVE